MKRPKRNPLDMLVWLPAGHLFHVLMAMNKWLTNSESLLDHVRRTGKWACEDEDTADPSEVLELSDRVQVVQESKAVAVAAIPPSVWRHIDRYMTIDDEPSGEPSPLTGKAAQDVADALKDDKQP